MEFQLCKSYCYVWDSLVLFTVQLHLQLSVQDITRMQW